LFSSARLIESAIQNKQHLKLEHVQPVMWGSENRPHRDGIHCLRAGAPWLGLDKIPGLPLGY
jgi:hypothetical protein